MSVYRAEPVAEACLALQDRCGVDVNMLLFALYAGSRGRSLSRADVEQLEAAVAPWRANVVRPLRSVRRWLKHRADPAGNDVQGLRSGVLAREIEAEGLQQQLMERVVQIDAGSPDVGIAAGNLLRYLTFCGLDVDAQCIAELSTLLDQAFPGTNGANALRQHAAASRNNE